jgi:RND family efflux transporter MFP subunit
MKYLASTLLCAAMLGGCGGHDHTTAASTAVKSPPLATMVAGETVAMQVQRLDGVLEATNQAVVSAQTSGRIIALPVDVNSRVEAGSVMVRLRSTESRAQLDQAEANLNAAAARASDAAKAFVRDQDVFNKHLIAAAQMDRSIADRDAAQSLLAAARAARDRAAEQLSYAVILAPFTGVVTARDIQIGEAVVPGQPLITLQAPGNLRAVADVSQRQADAIRQHPAARVMLDNGEIVTASSVTLFPGADPVTHTFHLRANLPVASAGLRPGMLVKILFDAGNTSTLAVPSTAIAWRGEVSGIYILHNGQISFRAISPGQTLADGRIEVLSGLGNGEQVVLDPNAAAAALNAAGAS